LFTHFLTVLPTRIILPTSTVAGLKFFKKYSLTPIPLKTLQSNQRRTILEMILGFLKLQQKWSYEDKGEATFQMWYSKACCALKPSKGWQAKCAIEK